MSRSHTWVKRGTEYLDPVPVNWGTTLTLLGAIRVEGWVVLRSMFATANHPVGTGGFQRPRGRLTWVVLDVDVDPRMRWNDQMDFGDRTLHIRPLGDFVGVV